MRIEHALRVSGRAGGVAEAGGGALVELLPGEIAVDLADPVLVGDGVLEFGRRHVRAVGQNDVALDRRQPVGERLHQRHEGQVDEHDPVFGVVDDPGDLLGEQARIDGVIDRAGADDAVPGFEMAIAVPGERRDPIAELDPVALEPLGDLERALANLAIVGVMHRPFDRPRGDLLLRELDGGEIDDLVHQQGPVLHPSQHAFFSRLPYRRLIAARGLFMGLTHWRPVRRFAMRRKWDCPRRRAPLRTGARCPTGRTPTAPLRVWFRLIRLEARMQAAVGERLREIGVSIPQCDVLTTLTEQEGVSQQELATRLYVTKGNISGLIDRLAEAGLVERRSTANDRRQHAIYLTEAGRADGGDGDRRPAPLDRLDPRPHDRAGPRSAGGEAGGAAGHRPRGGDARADGRGEGVSAAAPFASPF